MPIQFLCDNPACRKPMQADDAMEGKRLNCPACNREVAVPIASSDGPPPLPSTPPPLPPAAKGMKSCPNCAANLVANAVICIQCGFDFRTGKQLKTASAASPSVQPAAKKGPACLVCGEKFALGQTSCRTCAKARATLVGAEQPSAELLEVLRCCEVAANIPPVADLERELREAATAAAAGGKKGGSKLLGGIAGLASALEFGVNPLLGVMAGIKHASADKEPAPGDGGAEQLLLRKRAALAVLTKHGFPELTATQLSVLSKPLRAADLQELVRLMKQSENSEVRAAAAAGLGLLGRKAQAALPALFAMANDPTKLSRPVVVRSLASLVRDLAELNRDSAFAVMRKALEDRSPFVRQTAVEVLGTLHAFADEATPLLQLALKDGGAEVREAAQTALDRLASGKPEPQPAPIRPDCPKCGFVYKWDGSKCGHCGFGAG